MRVKGKYYFLGCSDNPLLVSGVFFKLAGLLGSHDRTSGIPQRGWNWLLSFGFNRFETVRILYLARGGEDYQNKDGKSKNRLRSHDHSVDFSGRSYTLQFLCHSTKLTKSYSYNV
jgi:hypothetical protein